MLPVIIPLTLINSPIGVIELPTSLHLIIHPIPLVHLAIAICQTATTICLVVPPMTFILSTILPDLNSLPMPLICHAPLANVVRVVVKHHLVPIFKSGLIAIIQIWFSKVKGWKLTYYNILLQPCC
jgi:hypothetical protein